MTSEKKQYEKLLSEFMDAEILRPCPFCGGIEAAFCEAGAAHGGRYGVIVCLNCGANVSYASASDRESENEVAGRWNRRSGKGE